MVATFTLVAKERREDSGGKEGWEETDVRGGVKGMLSHVI